MITIDAYIQIVFSILGTALFGALVPICIQNLSKIIKIKISITIIITAIILILIASIIYFYGRVDVSSLLPFKKTETDANVDPIKGQDKSQLLQSSLLSSNKTKKDNSHFTINSLVPFGRKQFNDNDFKNKYITILICYLFFGIGCIHAIYSWHGDVTKNKHNLIYFDEKHVKITLIIYIPISLYSHIWLVYMLCFYSLDIILCTFIYFALLAVEYGIIYFINARLSIIKAKRIGRRKFRKHIIIRFSKNKDFS